MKDRGWLGENRPWFIDYDDNPKTRLIFVDNLKHAMIPVGGVKEGKVAKIRWCETHDCQHMLKDACTRRLIALGDGPMGDSYGAVGLSEKLDGPQPCVAGDRWIVEDPDA